jgi:ribosomal protein S18 acetylase RimI-like enzyme
MALPDPHLPLFGLDAKTLRLLEAHQARAVTIPGRAWRDLGDSVMLFSAGETEPFFNRLVAVRWPSDPAGFEARLRDACDMFEALERAPHIWAVSGISAPPDLVDRLAANGFADQGGGYDMVLVHAPDEGGLAAALPGGAVLEHWNRTPPAQVQARAEALALIVGDAFEVPIVRRPNLVGEIGLTLGRPDFHAYVVTLHGEPVATGQRYTFDGASYLSSIGTRPAWQGRGFGKVVTNALVADSLADGVDLIYLGVYAENRPAIRLYEQLGFGVLGGRSADMLAKRSASG